MSQVVEIDREDISDPEPYTEEFLHEEKPKIWPASFALWPATPSPWNEVEVGSAIKQEPAEHLELDLRPSSPDMEMNWNASAFVVKDEGLEGDENHSSPMGITSIENREFSVKSSSVDSSGSYDSDSDYSSLYGQDSDSLRDESEENFLPSNALNGISKPRSILENDLAVSESEEAGYNIMVPSSPTVKAAKILSEICLIETCNPIGKILLIDDQMETHEMSDEDSGCDDNTSLSQTSVGSDISRLQKIQQLANLAQAATLNHNSDTPNESADDSSEEDFDGLQHIVLQPHLPNVEKSEISNEYVSKVHFDTGDIDDGFQLIPQQSREQSNTIVSQDFVFQETAEHISQSQSSNTSEIDGFPRSHLSQTSSIRQLRHDLSLTESEDDVAETSIAYDGDISSDSDDDSAHDASEEDFDGLQNIVLKPHLPNVEKSEISNECVSKFYSDTADIDGSQIIPEQSREQSNTILCQDIVFQESAEHISQSQDSNTSDIDELPSSHLSQTSSLRQLRQDLSLTESEDNDAETGNFYDGARICSDADENSQIIPEPPQEQSDTIVSQDIVFEKSAEHVSQSQNSNTSDIYGLPMAQLIETSSLRQLRQDLSLTESEDDNAETYNAYDGDICHDFDDDSMKSFSENSIDNLRNCVVPLNHSCIEQPRYLCQHSQCKNIQGCIFESCLTTDVFQHAVIASPSFSVYAQQRPCDTNIGAMENSTALNPKPSSSNTCYKKFCKGSSLNQRDVKTHNSNSPNSIYERARELFEKLGKVILKLKQPQGMKRKVNMDDEGPPHKKVRRDTDRPELAFLESVINFFDELIIPDMMDSSEDECVARAFRGWKR